MSNSNDHCKTHYIAAVMALVLIVGQFALIMSERNAPENLTAVLTLIVGYMFGTHRANARNGK